MIILGKIDVPLDPVPCSLSAAQQYLVHFHDSVRSLYVDEENLDDSMEKAMRSPMRVRQF